MRGGGGGQSDKIYFEDNTEPKGTVSLSFTISLSGKKLTV
jgi:hypothetical protein